MTATELKRLRKLAETHGLMRSEQLAILEECERLAEVVEKSIALFRYYHSEQQQYHDQPFGDFIDAVALFIAADAAQPRENENERERRTTKPAV